MRAERRLNCGHAAACVFLVYPSLNAYHENPGESQAPSEESDL